VTGVYIFVTEPVPRLLYDEEFPVPHTHKEPSVLIANV